MATVLYDQDCGFCRWSMAKILAWDRRGALRPVALQGPEADRLLPGMDPETKMASWHLLGPDGRVHSAGAAAAPRFVSSPVADPWRRWPVPCPGPPTGSTGSWPATATGSAGCWEPRRAP